MKTYAINPTRCDKSPSCIVRRECPVGAVMEIEGNFYIDTDACRGCGVCVKVCPRHAVEENAA